MPAFLLSVLQYLLSLEGVAVVLAVVYLLLASKQSLWCWACALVSSVIYIWICWQAHLFMETWLNVFYAVMAVLGWQQWRSGRAGEADGSKPKRAIVTMQLWQHGACLALVLVLAFANGLLMQRYTSAAWPFVDSFITWSSVVTTLLVVRKVLENWLYWIVIDGIATVVYFEHGLYLTTLLFAAYVVIVVFGYLQWRREFRAAQKANLPLSAQDCPVP